MTDSLTNMEAVKPKGPKVFVAALMLAAAEVWPGSSWAVIQGPSAPLKIPPTS